MSRRHATLAATLAGLSLLAAGCGGGGSDAAAETVAPDPALLAAEVAATPSGLVALGVTAPDPADARLRAYEEFGTPADVFAPLVSQDLGTTTVPSTLVPAPTVPATVTTPVTDTTTTSTGAPLVP